MAAQTTPQGTITRGTTNPNRLRRIDRFAAFRLGPTLRAGSLGAGASRLVVDLGYGASGRTPAEMHARLRAVDPALRTLGIEIDPARVEAAQAFAGDGLSFTLGGFEVPTPEPGGPADGGAARGVSPRVSPRGERPVLIRAYNVLRQYSDDEVARAWALMADALSPDGVLIEGTCDEIGRRCVFATIPCPDPAGAARPRGTVRPAHAAPPPAVPESLTISVATAHLERPSDVADRLPKALIHRNVPGEPVHDLLAAMDAAWLAAAGVGQFSSRQRWIAMCEALRGSGVPVLHGKARWRLGELTVPWSHVAPA